MVAIAIVSASGGGGGGGTATTTATTPAPSPPRRTTITRPTPKPKPIALTGVGSYDPEGDQRENDALAPLAVDGDPSTFWKTEHYVHGFTKSGVGLVLDAGRVRTISKVVVVTDSPGASAEIQLGDAPTGPFHTVSADRPLNGRTAFPLAKGASGRYLVVWITAIPEPAGEAHVAEVRAEG
jgi:hypothetical protein